MAIKSTYEENIDTDKENKKRKLSVRFSPTATFISFVKSKVEEEISEDENFPIYGKRRFSIMKDKDDVYAEEIEIYFGPQRECIPFDIIMSNFLKKLEEEREITISEVKVNEYDGPSEENNQFGRLMTNFFRNKTIRQVRDVANLFLEQDISIYKVTIKKLDYLINNLKNGVKSISIFPTRDRLTLQFVPFLEYLQMMVKKAWYIALVNSVDEEYNLFVNNRIIRNL